MAYGADEVYQEIKRDEISSLKERVKELEGIIEGLWKETGGILPSNGKMWLTPRMERKAKAISDEW